MKAVFKSNEFPSMNYFWDKLQDILEKLPKNGIHTEGFCLAYYDGEKKKMVAEIVGNVPKEKTFNYLHITLQQLTLALIYRKEKNWDAFILETQSGTYGMSILGFESRMNDAISVLALLAKIIISKDPLISNKPYLFTLIKKELEGIKRTLNLDNEWINILMKMLLK